MNKKDVIKLIREEIKIARFRMKHTNPCPRHQLIVESYKGSIFSLKVLVDKVNRIL